jgi:hypothetical protein
MKSISSAIVVLYMYYNHGEHHAVSDEEYYSVL